MKFKILYLFGCFLISSLFVIVIYCFSNVNGNKRNGFIRLLPSHRVVGNVSKDLINNSWYFSGINKESIFLGAITPDVKLLKVDTNLTDSNNIDLSVILNEYPFKKSTVLFDSTSFYLTNELTKMVLKSNIIDLNLAETINTINFTGIIPLTKNSFVLRYIDEKGENKLAKQIFGHKNIENVLPLEKQIDGIFCTDGEMVKVAGSSKMIYVYYYRNQFLCTDSNLNLLYKGKTIDTISKAQIKVAKIASTGETTMAAPPLYVNKRACANEKYLFVQSALRANNETEYMIKDVSMIDVYAVTDGKYQFSFYLPDFRGFKVRDFKVYGQSLYALYDHYLYKYQLNF